MLHRFENNAASQLYLDFNRVRLSAKCELVLRLLKEGKELRVREAAIDGIASLPRRIKDLRDCGVSISDRWEEGVKVYYMTKEQIKNTQ